MDVLVEIRHLFFWYGQRLVLEDINFDIKRGDFLAILGPNGSGKTTLLKCILGLLKPQKGEIKLFGVPVEEFSEKWRLGYVPQRAIALVDPVFPLSVEEVVGFGLLPKKKFPRFLARADKDAILKALKQVEMENYLHQRISKLSGGQQQRVFIARALVSRPEILILDEPTTGIDAATQERFYDLLAEFNQKGLTIVIVTHDIGIVNKHVKQVACLNRRLVYHGTHEEFCSSPRLQQIIGEHHLVIHRH
ncbi:metal ABC transporter ATP-binding protein [Thermodesulfatator autotrophicus]|uniref:Zinc ABC transporter ATP-binding protein n=1 Tax=Thermodesulfatator autotrophicus TaxID=1795632 RepID=A0A177EA67_9BACT|nr:metal ABC transporter ATP-binding protein [Thermodesulfatator autotrophicus]OAG28636.1 zinc ABC transporter ATP-binding protein [Thermodesulfatator autotrophicus]